MHGVCDLLRSLVHTAVDVIIATCMDVYMTMSQLQFLPLRVLTATVSLAESLLSKPSYTMPNSPVCRIIIMHANVYRDKVNS